MKMLKKESHLIVIRLGIIMNLIAYEIIHKMFRVIYLYSQILNNFHNILQRKNNTHKVNNLKFHYKISIKGGEGPKLKGLFDQQIYLL